MKRTVLLAAVLAGAVGCGADNGSGLAVTYSYADNEPVAVPATFCKLVQGPIAVGTGWMHYEVDDLGAGTDAIQAVIIPDSFFSTEKQCGFTPDQTVLDVSVSGSSSGDIRRSTSAVPVSPVPADTYDFVVTCGNTAADCAFNLTWSATYN